MFRWLFMPRRRQQGVNVTDWTPKGHAGQGTRLPEQHMATLPTSAERQAIIEQVLGLKPGELDARLCAERRREEYARMGRHMDEVLGVKT